MDYQKIYSAFIAQRKTIAESLTGYCEVHHILPRSMGGSDDKDNLVRLTPEDHFFAHLLLAKIHGGKMCSALFILMQTSKFHYGRRTKARRAYGLAKRIAIKGLSENWSGEKNPLFNPTEFEWVNYRTRERRRATLSAMHSEFGASRASWTSVASGDRPSIKGWLLTERLFEHKRSEKGQLFHFVCRDGRSFAGAQTEFCLFSGLNDATSWRIVHKRSVSRCGWRLDGVMDRLHNCPRDGSRSGKKASIFHLEKEGIRLSGDRHKLADALGSTVQQISAGIYLMRKKQATYKGWKLVA